MKRVSSLEDSVVNYINKNSACITSEKRPVTWHQLEEWSGISRIALQRNAAIRIAYVNARALHKLSHKRSAVYEQAKYLLGKTKNLNGEVK